jgi:hypothetical protein
VISNSMIRATCFAMNCCVASEGIYNLTQATDRQAEPTFENEKPRPRSG